MMIKKIVVIGGGTGVYTILSGLRKYPVQLTAIVSMADDGGSTGILREEFGILPPGDVRRALVALAHSDNRLLSELFNYRFKAGGLSGHTFGNIMLTALERVCGNFEKAVDEAAHILGVKGSVLPVTFDNIRLCAELEDGSIIRGETNIDIPKHDPRLRISRLFLKPQAKINRRAKNALLAADMIIIGPGDLFTSILPNLLVRGVTAAIARSPAKKVYIVNLMTKNGETNVFEAKDFVAAIEDYLGQGVIDYAIINNNKPSRCRLKRYEKESAKFVEVRKMPSRPTPVLANLLRKRGFVRHDPQRLAKVIMSLL